MWQGVYAFFCNLLCCACCFLSYGDARLFSPGISRVTFEHNIISFVIHLFMCFVFAFFIAWFVASRVINRFWPFLKKIANVYRHDVGCCLYKNYVFVCYHCLQKIFGHYYYYLLFYYYYFRFSLLFSDELANLPQFWPGNCGRVVIAVKRRQASQRSGELPIL